MEQLHNRRHADPVCVRVHERVETLERSHEEHLAMTKAIATRQDQYEASIERLNNGMLEGAKALQNLTDKLDVFAPLFETYSDLRATGRVIKWFMDNAKFLLVSGACVALILKADTIIPLITKALL